MTHFYLFISLTLLLLLLIGTQKLVNLQKNKRYQQVWLPIFALLHMFLILKFDDRFLSRVTEFLYDNFPILKDYSLIVLNLMILSSFVLIKTAWKNALWLHQFLKKKLLKIKMAFLHSFLHRLMILLPEKISNEITKKDESIFIVYHKTPHGIKLIPEWVFARKLFLNSCYLSFFLVVSHLFMAFFHIFPQIFDFYPKYPVLSFILLAELTWFLGGLLPENADRKISGEDANGQKVALYDELYEEYNRLWPVQILATSVLEDKKENREFHYQKLSEDPDIQVKINYICERIKKDGFEINGNYAQILTNILEEKDCLIEDPIYQELSPYFFHAIYGLLSRNKKLIVITNNSAAAKEAVNWFQIGIQKVTGLDFVWSVAVFPDAIEQNLDADILVLSQQDLLNPSLYPFLDKYKYTGFIEGIILLEAEKIISEFGLVLHLFNMKLGQIIRKKPQYIIMSQWYEDLEHSVRELLLSVPKDTLGSLPKSEKLYYMIWKLEGEEAFQSTILNRMIHRRLDPESIIALPAVKYGVETIHYVNQSKNTTYENIAELLDNHTHLKKYGIQESQLSILERNMHFYYQNLGIPIQDFSFIVARDQNYNLVDTLMSWYSIGKKACFVHVISPSYLLRDYFARNIEYFLDNNRKFSPLSARVSNTTWRKAYVLLERLSSAFLTEEEIQKAIGLSTCTEDTVIEGLNKFYRSFINKTIDFIHLLTVKNEDVFDKNKHSFVNMTKYYLPPKAIKDIFPDWFQFLNIRTNTGETLDQVLEGNIYQNYLVGQYHAFNGSLYQITNIDKRLGVINVSFEAPIGDLSYRQSREYHLFLTNEISTKWNETIPVEMSDYEIRKCLVEPEVKVYTNGYFSFTNGIDLYDTATNFTKLNGDSRKVAFRHYPKGNVLVIKLSSRYSQLHSPNKIAFTLSHILNELFPTLFPQTFQYLAACTFLPDEFFIESAFLEKLGRFSPQLWNVNTENSEEAIYLYIIEDSPLNMGLLESINEKWDHILEILVDYLDWTIYEMQKGYKPFFFLGHPELPAVFDIENTVHFIHCLTPHNHLQGLRKNKTSVELEEATVQQKIGTVECDFCGEAFPIAEKESLEDKRDRCLSCRETAIDTVKELEPLYDEVRDYFIFQLKLSIRQDIYVKLLSTNDIQDQPFIPTASFDPRIIGKAIRSADNQFTILIENGAPKKQTLATLAHELTHIWQFEHLNLEEMTIEQLEGHAVWTEIHYLETLGEWKYANKLKVQMAQRNDEYGRGYRELMEVLKEYPKGMTPFGLYRDKVIVKN